MGFVDMRRIEDVHNALAGGEKIVRNDPPVAAPPDSLGAHDRAAVPAASIAESRETRGERRHQRVIRIIAKAAHVPISVGRRILNKERIGRVPKELPPSLLTLVRKLDALEGAHVLREEGASAN
jgi:hypothetical protein